MIKMRLLNRPMLLKLITNFNSYGSRVQENPIIMKQYTSLTSLRPQLLRKTLKFSTAMCLYSSDKSKEFIDLHKKADVLKDVFDHKKEQLKDTEHRIRQKGEKMMKDLKHQREVTGQKFRERREHIVKDILETKAKVRERLEIVVEKENVFTIPNVLCVMRIGMSPYLGYVIMQGNYNLALGLMAFAGITDLADGWIARKWKSQSSKMGSFLDPMADKVLIATLFITLTYQSLIPLPLTLLIVARDVALVAAAFVIRYKSLPPPRTLSRYFDVTHATAQLEPTFISKVNTAVQLTLVGCALASPVFGFAGHPAMQALCAVTAGTTLISAVSYVVSKNTYKILRKKP